jgi:hypothetical protein
MLTRTFLIHQDSTTLTAIKLLHSTSPIPSAFQIRNLLNFLRVCIPTPHNIIHISTLHNSTIPTKYSYIHPSNSFTLFIPTLSPNLSSKLINKLFIAPSFYQKYIFIPSSPSKTLSKPK